MVPRAGVALAMRPGLEYSVVHVHDEWEELTNGILQAVTVDIPIMDVGLTGMYVSPNISPGPRNNFLTRIMETRSGTDWIIDDARARDSQWDTAGNAKGRAIRRKICGTQYQAVAPAGPSFHAQGRRASRTPDLVLANRRGGSLILKEDGP